MKRIAVLILVLIAALSILAYGSTETIVYVDGGLNLTGGGTLGPGTVIAHADSAAHIQFFWKDVNGLVVKTSPNYLLKIPYQSPRTFNFAGGPDSCYIDIRPTPGVTTNVTVTY